MIWNEIVIQTTPDNIENASLFFYNHGILSLNIEDPTDMMDEENKLRWDYIEEELLKKDRQTAYIKVYVEDNNEAKSIVEDGKNEGFNIYLNRLRAEDWENGWKKYYKTFNITDDIVIVPAWEDYDKKDDEKVIILDSGMAFGTGTHETTKMCMEFLTKEVSENKKVIDIGTGSGILAIASSLCGSKDITAIDIDELAVKVAKENVMLNDATPYVNVVHGDLLCDINDKYDVIIANIVADVIKILIPDIHKFMNKDGCFIVSGIINERKDEVIDFAIKNGLKLKEVKTMGEWSSMVFI